MKAFILTRQSSSDSNDPEESLSLDVQVKECKALAKSNDIEVIDVFKEPNTSGRLFPCNYEALAAQDIIYLNWCKETRKIGQYRKGLGEILRRLDEVDCIICYDITRFFRPLNGSYLSNLLTQTLQVNGVKLLTVREGEIDFSRFTDSLVSSLTSQINSEQLLIQRDKAKSALKKLRDAGEFHSGLSHAFGYKHTGRRFEVVIDEEEAKIVRDIFRLYNSAASLSEITQYLFKTYGEKYRSICYHVALRRIIRKPVYAGYMFNSDGELIRCKQTEGKEIIDLQTWMTAYKKLESRKQRVLRPKRDTWLPLSPYMWCGHCGSKMLIKIGAGRLYYYTCNKHLRFGGENCKNGIDIDKDEKYGVGLHQAIKPLLLALAIEKMKNSKSTSDIEEKISVIEMKLNETAKKEKKFTEMYMSASMSEEVYDTAMKELKLKTDSLKKERMKLEREMQSDPSEFEWTKLQMKFRGDALTEAEYEFLVNELIKKIVVYKEFIEVKTTMGDVTLPRYHYWKWHLVCNFILEMKKQKAAVYFYKGKARIIRDYSNAEKIGQLGEVNIYQIN